MHGRARLIICAVGCLLGAQGLAADLRLGMRLQDALALLRADGLTLAYSSDLISPGMRIDYLPDTSDPVELLRTLLAPWQLELREAPDGALLIVRAAVKSPPPATRAAARTYYPRPARPDELVVNASRYRFQRGIGPSFAGLGAAALQTEPEIGDDPLRALARLPGATRSDFSARTNVRGGSSNENLILFDGLRLYDPFHLKGFQGLFSAVDTRLVESMDVYMGGFPARYGDSMSSITNLRTIAPTEPLYGEITASFFNLSGLLSGNAQDAKTQWLMSARRGNLDRVIDVFNPKLGDPRYFEVHGRLSHDFSEGLTLTGNAMISKDNIRIVDTDEEEFATGDYRDQYYWLRADLKPGDNFSGNILVSKISLENYRQGTVEKDGASNGELREDNSFRISGVQTAWAWIPKQSWQLEFGAEVRRESGRYDYFDVAEFELLFDTPGAPLATMRANARAATYSGSYAAVWSSLQMPLAERFTAEFGLRWHRETLSPVNDTAIDPRISLRIDLGGATTMRLGAGRYSQPQTVNDLDFADGTLTYAPLQSADHYIASLEHEFSNGMALRSEVYTKRYRNLRPRYDNFLDTFSLLPQLWPDRIRIDAERGRARGLEVSVSSSNSDTWNWWLTYSLGSAQDDFGDRMENRSWDQRHGLGAGLSRQTGRWEFSVSGIWRTGWRTSSTALSTTVPIPVISVTDRYGQTLGDYKRLDARIARIFELEQSQILTVFLEVYNLTNHRNDCCVQFEFTDENGPFEYLTDRENQVPFFPSLGFIWQF